MLSSSSRFRYWNPARTSTRPVHVAHTLHRPTMSAPQNLVLFPITTCPVAIPGKATNSEFGSPVLIDVNGRVRTGPPNTRWSVRSSRQKKPTSTPYVRHGSSHAPARSRTPEYGSWSTSPPNKTTVPGFPRKPTGNVAGLVVTSGGTVSSRIRHQRYSTDAQNSPPP